jgi:hypothetical protein
MKRKKDFSAADFGTPEMGRQFRIVPKLTDNTTMAGRVLDGDEVDKLLLVDAITTVQHATLRTLQKKLLAFGFATLRSPDYSSPIHADATAVADKKANTIRGAVHLFSRMDKHPHIGKHRRKKLVNLVMEDAPWGKLRHQMEELHAIIRALEEILIGR